MDLGGTWQAVPGDDELRRTFADVDLDDSSWHPLVVPGHWRNDAAFADVDGPVMYRRRFQLDAEAAPAADRRSWLTFDGAFYQSDVWLDGDYLGDTEGYFVPHTFEITDAMAARSEHLVAVELTCDPQHDRSSKRNITGVFQHWDCIDPDWNPGGLWRPVRVHHTGPVRIDRMRVLCTSASPERATVRFRAELDSIDATTVTVTSLVGDDDHVETLTLAAGSNRVEWTVTIDQPALWWPHALGDQPLHDVEVAVAIDDRVSDRHRCRIGLREIAFDDWVCHVNGERMYLKGSNAAPVRQDLGEASAEDMARDVQLAIDANLDLLRIHAHVSRPEIYEAADEAGLLLWQDFPLQWGYARSIKAQAVRQARKAVDLLGHHASIAMWCCHNEPMGIAETEIPDETIDMAKLAAKMASHQLFPTWNKSVLDRALKKAFEKADGTRMVVPHSGVWPHPPKWDGTDTHVYFGWYHGQERDFALFVKALPRLNRFVTEFGAQAIPPNDDFIDASSWPDLDWDTLRWNRNLQRNVFDRVVPPGDYDTYEGWKAATGAYQAKVIRHHIETLRRIKYRPSGGFCQFSFNDAYPSVTWSVLDHLRAPKPGYEALTEACRPVIIVCDRLPETVRPGSSLGVDVHVVSDLRVPLPAARATATLSWPGGSSSWTWDGDLAADSVSFVGHITAEIPDVSGELVLDLALVAGDVTASNRDRTTIV